VGVDAVGAVATGAVLFAETILDADAEVLVVSEGFGRLARGEAGREGGSWVADVVVVSRGGGVVSLVMIWENWDLDRNWK
jgi:hypothetical protein